MSATTPELAGAASAPRTATQRVLLVGGTSEIGLSIVRRLAERGPLQPCLVGRDRDGLEATVSSLRDAGMVQPSAVTVDALDFDRHEQAITDAAEQLGGDIDVAVLAVGLLGAQAGLDADPAQAVAVMQVNFAGAGSLLMHVLRRLRAQGRGTLIVLSSVAAERGRAGNAIYGAAKAGEDALAQGLADSLAGSDVRVLVVRPGFVHTRMTAGLEAAPMATTADAVAEATVRALDGRAHTIWVPGRLRVVFAILRHVPRAIYRRLPL